MLTIKRTTLYPKTNSQNAYFYKMKDIPLQLLKDRTSLGLQLKHFKRGDVETDDTASLGAHRDDHYIFFLVEQGSASMMIDFNEVHLNECILYYVLPTQVHARIKNQVAEGWFLAVDTSLIAPEYRNIFESRLLNQQAYPLNEINLRQYQNLLTLLKEKYDDDSDPFYVNVVHSLLQSFITIAAGCYSGNSGMNLKVSRPAQISREFKNLLLAELRTTKSPAVYAALLNVSESYLNESLKKTTGFSVSYWIQQEVMLEAKRLLYYSQLTVKEIAHNLGYTDHSYFSRFFRKVTGISAVAFRELYRK